MARSKLLALLLVTGLVVAGGAVAAADQQAQLEEPPTNDTDTAEDAYVTEDGDVILVYEEDATDEGTGHVGVNVSEGLAYGFFQNTDLDENVTGSLSMLANRTQVNGSGSLSAPRPEDVESLDLEVDSETSADGASSDATLETTVGLPEDSAMLAAVFRNAETSGQFRTTATTLSTDGSGDWTATLPTMSAQQYDYDLRATEDGHVLDVDREGEVSEREAGMWDTREKATERIRQQFEGLTASVDGSSDVTIENYAFEETDDGGQLELAYTVELEGLNELLRESIATGFSGPMGNGQSSFGPSADEIRSEVADLSIERASVAVETDSGGGAADWNVTVENYDGLVRGYFAAMEASGEGAFVGEQADQYESQLEAMEAADHAQTASWDVGVETTDDGEIAANASLSQRADNWDAYVSERDDRDLPPIGTQRFELDVLADADRIDADGSFLTHQDDLYNRTLETLERGMESGDVEDPSVAEGITAIRDAGFLGARLDASVNETSATVEGGSAFENLTALVETMDVADGNATVERMYASQDDDNARAHVRLTDAVETDDADPSAVRQLSFVSGETDVHMPGEWDPDDQSFETLDTDAVRSYVPNTGTGSDSSSEDGLPTTLLIGGGVAALLVVAVGAVAWQRRI